MIIHPKHPRLMIDGDIWEEFSFDLLTDEAFCYLIALHDQFAQKIAEERDLSDREQQAINRNPEKIHAFRQDADSIAIRAGNWRVAEGASGSFMKTPGVILVSPAQPEMIVKALTTQNRYGNRPVANMIDFEDAFHLDLHKVLEGQRVLQQVKKGRSQVVVLDSQSGEKKFYNYDHQKDGVNLVRVRINGLNTPPVKEVCIDGNPIERALLCFGLHSYLITQQGVHDMIGPYYVLPKIDYDRALIWIEMFEFAEKYLKLPPKTIKCSAIIETIKGDFDIQEVAFVLAGGRKEHIERLKKGEKVVFDTSYIEAFCSGRHDRVFDMMKVYQNYADKVFPESKFTGIYDTAAQQSWSQIAEVSNLRGLTPVGGMVVALTSDAATREAAIKITAESLENEHSRGSVQAWEAMPDTTELAMSILTRTSRAAKKVFDHSDKGKKEPTTITAVFQDSSMERRKEKLKVVELEVGSKLHETPKGEVSSVAIYNNINQAIEYIEAWFRGYGVIPFRNRLALTKPVIMQNMATTERARSELWSWLHHGTILSDKNKPFTKEIFLSTIDQVLEDIQNSIEEGFLPKGKMSCDDYKKGHYQKSAEILKSVVLSDHFEENLKGILLDAYHEIYGRL